MIKARRRGAGTKRDPSAPDSLAKRLDDKREKLGLSIRELARRSRICYPNLSRILSGKHWPSLGSLTRLCSELGVEMGKVLDGLPDSAEERRKARHGSRSGC